MIVNRISGYWGSEINGGQGIAAMTSPGFAANPFASSLPAWQVEVYQAAFLAAQKDMEGEGSNDFPWAETWN